MTAKGENIMKKVWISLICLGLAAIACVSIVLYRRSLKQNYRATVASETKAKECADFFDTVRPLRK